MTRCGVHIHNSSTSEPPPRLNFVELVHKIIPHSGAGCHLRQACAVSPLDIAMSCRADALGRWGLDIDLLIVRRRRHELEW